MLNLFQNLSFSKIHLGIPEQVRNDKLAVTLCYNTETK